MSDDDQDELAKRRSAVRAGILKHGPRDVDDFPINEPDRIGTRALAESMTIQELREQYVLLIEAVGRMTSALEGIAHPIENWRGDGAIDEAIRLLKSARPLTLHRSRVGNFEVIEIPGSCDSTEIGKAIRKELERYMRPKEP